VRFTYAPEGADPKSWDFKPGKLMSVEAELIERTTGMTYAEWLDALGSGSMSAQHALLWVFMKRSNPAIKYDEIQFCADDIQSEPDDDEAQQALDKLRSLAAERALSPIEQQALTELELRGIDSASQTSEAAGPKAES
jgi:hypothetical protein